MMKQPLLIKKINRSAPQLNWNVSNHFKYLENQFCDLLQLGSQSEGTLLSHGVTQLTVSHQVNLHIV